MVYDAVSTGGGPLKIPITKEMIKEVRLSSRRYKSALEKKQTEEAGAISAQAEKRRIEERLKDINNKKNRIVSAAEEEAAKLEEEAEQLKMRKSLRG